jgi:hypothetical protein
MPRVGFEPMTQVFKRKKTVHALDRTATVIGRHIIETIKKLTTNQRNNYDVRFSQFWLGRV